MDATNFPVAAVLKDRLAGGDLSRQSWSLVIPVTLWDEGMRALDLNTDGMSNCALSLEILGFRVR